MITIGSIGSIGKRRSATAAILISERLSYDETTIVRVPCSGVGAQSAGKPPGLGGGASGVTDYSYTPIYTVTETECPDEKRRVVRIEQALEAYEGNYLDSITKSCKEGMEKALTRIEERLVMKTEEKK